MHATRQPSIQIQPQVHALTGRRVRRCVGGTRGARDGTPSPREMRARVVYSPSTAQHTHKPLIQRIQYCSRVFSMFPVCTCTCMYHMYMYMYTCYMLYVSVCTSGNTNEVSALHFLPWTQEFQPPLQPRTQQFRRPPCVPIAVGINTVCIVRSVQLEAMASADTLLTVCSRAVGARRAR